MKRTAQGRDAILGFVVDESSDEFQVGHPGFSTATVAGPTTKMTVGTGSAGSMTGDFQFCYTYVIEGFETPPSPASSTLVLTADQASLSVIAVCSDSRCKERRVYMRYRVTGTSTWSAWMWVGGIYNNSGTTLTVDIPGDSGYLDSTRGPKGVSKPPAPVITNEGTPGSTTYTYKVVAVQSDGSTSDASSGGTTTSGAASLDGTDYNVITGQEMPNAVSYDFYRTVGGGSTGLIGSSSTPVLNDTGLVGDAGTAPSTNKTGYTLGNYQTQFIRFDSVNLEANYAMIVPAEVTGRPGRARGVPGTIAINGAVTKSVRPIELALALTAIFGAPTRTYLAGGVKKFYWNSLTVRDYIRSLSAWWFSGGSVTDMGSDQFFGLMSGQLQLTNGKDLAQMQLQLMGAAHGLSGFGVEETGGSTYNGTLVARGVRQDPLSASDDVYVKVTTAPTGGTFGLKFKVGSGTTYDGTEWTGYYNTTSKKQTKGGRLLSDWIEAFDENDLALGANEAENRVPYSILFTGDITTLALNDVFRIPRVGQVAGIGSGRTGVPERFLSGPRFTSANAFVKRGGTTLEATALSLQLQAAKAGYSPLGHEARLAAIDMDETGDYQATMTIQNRYRDRAWETLQYQDDRFAMEVLLDGPPIYSAPGVVTAYNESASFAFAQCAVSDEKHPTQGKQITNESITVVAEEPDSRAPFMEITIYTAEDIAIPA